MVLRSTTVGTAFFVEEGNQRLADAEFGDGGGGVEFRVGAHGLRRRLDGLLVARGEGAQGVLDAVAELAEDFFRDVERVLRDEIDADALRADQADDLFDLVGQRLRRIAEQQVGFVEEEDQLRLVEVAGFRQLLEQLGEQPEQEGRVERRRLHQLFGGQHVDDATAVLVDLHQVVDVEHRLAEEDVAALLFQRQQAALDGADRGGGDVAVFGGEILGVVADVLDASRAGP